MSSLEHATPFTLLLVLAITLPLAWAVTRARRRAQTMYIRAIPGIAAIQEAIGQSVERGRPVAFTTGMTQVGPVLVACLGILRAVVERVARLRATLIIPQNDPEVVAVVDDAVRDGYRAVGRSQDFDPRSIRFLSGDQFAFASGYMGIIHRERVGAALLFGSFAAEALILSEAGQQVGAMQVAGTISPEQVPFFVCTCDYTLIGEELFAASAYLTRDPIQLGSVYAQDIGKAVLFLLVICGVVSESLRAFGVIDVDIQALPDFGRQAWEALWGGNI